MSFNSALQGALLRIESLTYSDVIAVGLATATVIVLTLPFWDPLASVPGPFWARWSPAWMIHHSLKGDMHRKMIRLHEKYGTIVRTGPYEVSVSDPDAIQVIYDFIKAQANHLEKSSGAGSFFKKSDWYSVWQGRRKFDLFAERDAHVHGTNRKFVNSIYSQSRLAEFEPYLDTVIHVFLSRLSQMATKNIDIGYWAQLFAFGKSIFYGSSNSTLRSSLDVIGELTFSKRFGFIEGGSDKGTFVQIEQALQSASWIGQVPWLYWIHDWLSPWIGNHLKVANRHGLLREIAVKEVTQRGSTQSTHPDMLDKFMDVHRGQPDKFDETAVMSMTASNIFAGSDTTAISIGAILYYLCKHPQYKEELLKEIDAEADAGRITRTNVPYKVAQNMPYLQSCIQEGLRCHPAVGMSMPRVVPPAGLVVNGKRIPGGIIAGANPWVIHRNKEIFGDDADVFRPDRWLDDDISQKKRFFFAFGAGSRTCIGKGLSLLEISKLLPSMLLEYDIEFADPTSDMIENC
ncbi:hypothetical protein N7466_000550 [Penicillium verhagenii]|uniref:uncharacterized protein n=1 Tax=Penicillium verhagenii TaxID=1562060 RepID=UPI0025456CA9|nr:uncharacterized protein N7466_000550 [Penicillium verhagenii]KAJ5947535.1 hypothetical protein N7466_000550 [Penicillium verhagenii]